MKYNNEQYEIADTDYGHNFYYFDVSLTLFIKTDKGRKEIIINNSGDVSGHFGSFNLKNENLQLVIKNT